MYFGRTPCFCQVHEDGAGSFGRPIRWPCDLGHHVCWAQGGSSMKPWVLGVSHSSQVPWDSMGELSPPTDHGIGEAQPQVGGRNP